MYQCLIENIVLFHFFQNYIAHICVMSLFISDNFPGSEVYLDDINISIPAFFYYHLHNVSFPIFCFYLLILS